MEQIAAIRKYLWKRIDVQCPNVAKRLIVERELIGGVLVNIGIVVSRRKAYPTPQFSCKHL